MATEAPNTLRSRAKYRIVDMLSEGPIVGLAEGLKSIYLNGTPIQANGGELNFKSFNEASDLVRLPKPIYPDSFYRKYIAASNGTISEATETVNTKVTKDAPEGSGTGDGSVIRTITDSDLDAVRVTMRIPALFAQNTSTGDSTGLDLRFKISVASNGGPYVPPGSASAWEAWTTEETQDNATGLWVKCRLTLHILNRLVAKSVNFQYSRKVGGSWGTWVSFKTISYPAQSPSADQRSYWNNQSYFQSGYRDVEASVSNLEPGTYKVRMVTTNLTATLQSKQQFVPAHITITGKCVAPYDVSYVVNLPEGGAPWTIKVERISDDRVASNYQDDLYWLSYTELSYEKFAWPNLAGFELTLAGEDFDSIPDRAYDVFGLMISIPSNYDPYNRTYSGIWDGTFQTNWTDNPAWILYDLIKNKRYGLGDNIPESYLETLKWSLYSIAQYCDENITIADEISEPRYTCSCVINSQQEAYDLLNTIVSTFRGMLYPVGEGLMAVADRLTDPVINVGPANVIDGMFVYRGPARRTIHTAAYVTWNNPDDGYKLNTALYENQEGIARYGYKIDKINAVGACSKSLAIRLAKWKILTEVMAPDTVTYRASFDHLNVMPGDIINVSDPAYTSEELIGRILSITDNEDSTHTVELDRSVARIGGDESILQLTLPNQTILSIDVSVVSTTTGTEIIVPSAELTTMPVTGAMWLLSKETVRPRMWRVFNIEEAEKNIYEVSASLVDPEKWDEIEGTHNFEPADYTAFPSGELPAPTGLAHSEFLKQSGNSIVCCVNLSWTAPDDARAAFYRAEYRKGTEPWKSTEPVLCQNPSIDVFDIEPGTYDFRVQAQDGTGLMKSDWTYRTGQTLYGKQKAPENVTGFSGTVEKFGILLKWTPVSDIDIDFYEVRTGATWAGSAATAKKTKASELKIEDATTGTYQFWIAAKDTTGNYSATPVTTSVTVSAQSIPTVTATSVTSGIQINIGGSVTRGFKAYEVQRRAYPAGTATTINNNVLTTKFNDSDIATLGYTTQWQYRVRALDQNGDASGWSNWSTQKTAKQVEGVDITANQIIAKDFRTCCNAGNGTVSGVLFNANGIQAWNGATNTFCINAATGDVSMTGTITANNGLIGGWCIQPGCLCATNAKLYSGAANTARVEMGTGATSAGINSANAGTDISFWAGSTFSNRATAPFNVLANGAMSSTKGTIGGWCIESDCLHSTNVLMASNGTLQTKNFASGNRGWKIDQFGMAEFNDVRARGSIKTTVFEKDEISVVGGRTLIRPAGVVSCYDYTATLNTSACVALTARWAQLTCLLGYSSTMPTMTFADYAEYYAAEAEYYRQTAIALGCAIYQPAILEADYSDIAKDAYFTDCWNLLNEILDTTETVPSFASMSYSGFITAEEGYFDSTSEVLDDPRPFVAAINENDTVVYLDDVDSFDVGDIVRIKDFELAGDYWSRVTGTGSDINGCYLNLSWLHGDLFPMTSGQAAVNYGVAGSGGILLDGQAPTIDVYTHDGAPWLGTNLWLRLGNLAGWGTINHNVFGIAVGLPEANHMSYRADTGILSITGAINITGGSGIANFSDAGALATASDLDDVPNGATYYKTTANEVTGAGRAYSGLDSNNSLITKVLPGAAIGTPAGSGLYLGSDVMGFYNNGWKTYMDNSGNFALIGGGTHGLGWNANTGILTIAGAISILSGSGYGNLTDKPTSLAGINSTEGSKLTGIEAGADVTSTHTSADTTNVAGTAAATVRDNAANALANAATAQYTANAAVSSAATANGLLADIAADNKLTPVEKQSARKEWDIIAAEQPINSLHAMSIVGFTAGLPSAGFSETVSDAYWSGAWTLLNTLLDESNAEPAFAAQIYAAFVAEESTYYNLVKQVIDSEIITVPPTPDVLALNNAYIAAFQSLANYLNAGSAWSSGVPLWISDANLSATDSITGSTFRSTWKAYYDARTALLNAIAARAQIIADLAQAAAGSVSLRVDSTLDVNNNLITAVIPKSAVVPVGTGLFLGSDYLGYYNGSTWKTYMDRSGNFYLGGSSAGCGLAWDSAKNCLTICGCVTSSAGNIAGWNINSKCLSKGNLILNSDGAISGCYSGDTTGWCIDSAGNAKFNNATVRGVICACGGGNIGGFTINATEGLYAGTGATRVQMKPGAGFWAGATAIGDAPFRVTNAGALTACSGRIGLFDISSTGMLCGEVATYNNTGISLKELVFNYQSQMFPGSLVHSNDTSCTNYSISSMIMADCSAAYRCDARITPYSMCFSYKNLAGSAYYCNLLYYSTSAGGVGSADAALNICMFGGTSCYAMCTNGKIWATGGTVCTSDRNMKTDFQDVNVLELLRQMPVTKWRFKDSCDYRIGPMAQDFNSLFRLNQDWQTNLTVSGLDGIALKAIKEVDENVQTHDKCIVSLKEKLQKLECEMAAIREMIN